MRASHLTRIIISVVIAVAVVAGSIIAGMIVSGRQNPPEPAPPPATLQPATQPEPAPPPTPSPAPPPEEEPPPVYNDEGEWQDAYAEFLPDKRGQLLWYIGEEVLSIWEDPGRQASELARIEDKLLLVYDIDKNGIPELVFINGQIYTYKHGEIKLLEGSSAFWKYWEDADALTFSVVGVPDDGGEGLFVFDSTTHIPGRGTGRNTTKTSTIGTDVSHRLERIYIIDDAIETDYIYFYDNAYDYYTRRVYENIVDGYGMPLNILQYNWLQNRNTYTAISELHDITEETIEEEIFGYTPPPPPGPPASALTADEKAYAEVFGRMVDILGYFYKCNFGTVTEISAITYAFYDIDGNGTSELIISDGSGAVIYTLAEDGTAAELVNWDGNHRAFLGINELGQICGIEASDSEDDLYIIYIPADNAVKTTNDKPAGPYAELGRVKLSYTLGR